MKSEGIDVTQHPAHVLRRVKRDLKQPPPRLQLVLWAKNSPILIINKPLLVTLPAK